MPNEGTSKLRTGVAWLRKESTILASERKERSACRNSRRIPAMPLLVPATFETKPAPKMRGVNASADAEENASPKYASARVGAVEALAFGTPHTGGAVRDMAATDGGTSGLLSATAPLLDAAAATAATANRIAVMTATAQPLRRRTAACSSLEEALAPQRRGMTSSVAWPFA